MNDKCTIRRVIAYVIDFVIITFIASLFAKIAILNPDFDKETEVSEKYLEYVQEISQSGDAQELLSNDNFNNITYDVMYYGKYASLISIVVSLIYFVGFQFYNKGKTIGKAIFKINVVDVKNNNLKIWQVLVRALIADNIFFNTLSLVLLFVLSKGTYIKCSNFIDIFSIGITFLTFGMMVARNDGRGLHDILAGTNVVDVEYDDEEVEVVNPKTKKRGK